MKLTSKDAKKHWLPLTIIGTMIIGLAVLSVITMDARQQVTELTKTNTQLKEVVELIENNQQKEFKIKELQKKADELRQVKHVLKGSI